MTRWSSTSRRRRRCPKVLRVRTCTGDLLIKKVQNPHPTLSLPVHFISGVRVPDVRGAILKI